MATTLQILLKARKLIETPERWTKRADARNKGGLPVNPTGRNAVSLCILGAIVRAGRGRSAAACATFRELTGIRGIMMFNDAPRRTHAQVLKAFDRAIARARTSEGGER